MRTLTTGLALLLAALGASASEIHPPAQATAGTGSTNSTHGSSSASFFFFAPASASKRQVQAGSDIPVDSDQLEHAGRYTAILCASDGCTSANFVVNPAPPNRLSFLVHPSRVPVDSPNRISAVAFVFDNFHNLVLQPDPVTLSILPKDGAEDSAPRNSENGVAWVRLSSPSQ